MIGRADTRTFGDEDSGTAMVAARGVEKTYEAGGTRVRALRGVDLTVGVPEQANKRPSEMSGGNE